jgi:hypothetical protein
VSFLQTTSAFDLQLPYQGVDNSGSTINFQAIQNTVNSGRYWQAGMTYGYHGSKIPTPEIPFDTVYVIPMDTIEYITYSTDQSVATTTLPVIFGQTQYNGFVIPNDGVYRLSVRTALSSYSSGTTGIFETGFTFQEYNSFQQIANGNVLAAGSTVTSPQTGGNSVLSNTFSLTKNLILSPYAFQTYSGGTLGVVVCFFSIEFVGGL